MVLQRGIWLPCVSNLVNTPRESPLFPLLLKTKTAALTSELYSHRIRQTLQVVTFYLFDHLSSISVSSSHSLSPHRDGEDNQKSKNEKIHGLRQFNR